MFRQYMVEYNEDRTRYVTVDVFEEGEVIPPVEGAHIVDEKELETRINDLKYQLGKKRESAAYYLGLAARHRDGIADKQRLLDATADLEGLFRCDLRAWKLNLLDRIGNHKRLLNLYQRSGENAQRKAVPYEERLRSATQMREDFKAHDEEQLRQDFALLDKLNTDPDVPG